VDSNQITPQIAIPGGDTTNANQTTEVVKKKKVPKGTLKFIVDMQYLLPEKQLDFTLDEANQFTSDETRTLFEVYNKGRRAQTFYEPGFFIIGKLTDSGEIQLSDQPKVLRNTVAADTVVNAMSRRFGGMYFYMSMSRALAGVLRKKLALSDEKELEKLKVVSRPNAKAK
jgi:hypothetical protein